MSYQRKHTVQIIITNFLAMLFIFLFSYAALSKLISYPVFKDQLSQVPLLSQAAPFLAWALFYLTQGENGRLQRNEETYPALAR